jgi:hypothetical protein
MSDAEFLDRVHYSWIHYLVEQNYPELAALVVDAKLNWLHQDYSGWGTLIDLPSSPYGIVRQDTQVQEILKTSLLDILDGHVTNSNNEPVDSDRLRSTWEIQFRRKLLDVSDNWRAVIKDLIAQSKDPNQGTVSEKVLTGRGKSMHTYNNIKFASRSEIRVAQELEKRKVLFFPLPLAVRAETGDLYRDHKEPDFLVCVDSTWGILEVAYHPDRYEKDAERDAWFQKSGILCVRHYTAERCYNSSATVVDEFLDILKKHRR